MLRARISRRRPRGAPGVTSFEVLVGGYISVEFDVLISSSCFVFLLHAAMTSMWFSCALGCLLPLLVPIGGTCMHECTDIVAERQQGDLKFSLLCSRTFLLLLCKKQFTAYFIALQLPLLCYSDGSFSCLFLSDRAYCERPSWRADLSNPHLDTLLKNSFPVSRSLKTIPLLARLSQG
jgi:hypothetical protein